MTPASAVCAATLACACAAGSIALGPSAKWTQERSAGSAPNHGPRPQQEESANPSGKREVTPLQEEGRDALRPGYAGRHAVVIGINEYQDRRFQRLRSAEADATEFARILKEKYDFPEDRVLIRLSQGATKSEIESILDDWATNQEQIGTEDFVVVYFAGHGATRTLPGGTKQGYFIPADAKKGQQGEDLWASYFGMERLLSISPAIPAKHVLFILDCCFSGLARPRSSAPIAAGLTMRARQVITAGSENQTSEEIDGQAHSVFTAALLDALKGRADSRPDQVITFGEIFDYVGRRVSDETGSRQTPLQFPLPGDKGGCTAFFSSRITPQEMNTSEEWNALKAVQLTLEEQLEENQRLADVIVARDLERKVNTLWPRRPERAPQMRRWLADARDAASRLSLHEDRLLRIRRETYLSQVVAKAIPENGAEEPAWEKAESGSRWINETSLELVSRLREIKATIEDVERRLETAETIAESTVTSCEEEWSSAIEEIALLPVYGGLEIQPIVGLVPLDPDPESGLWEFWHFESGARPERDPDSGRLRMTGDSGIVLVLLPGGTFRMGSRKPRNPEKALEPNEDPEAMDREGPVHEVTLDPFLISKYELTQGQWIRFTGGNPSGYGPESAYVDGLSNPVEQVSWTDCAAMLPRVALDLPTEAQWEYAARAGTTTIWWTGNDRKSVQGAANLADRFAKDHEGLDHWTYDLDLEDGYTIHAPVGAFRPNPFGLHDTMGNVWEWCRDWYGYYVRDEKTPGTGELVVEEEDREDRIARGGGINLSSSYLRSGFRDHFVADTKEFFVGVRPAMNLPGRN